MRLKPATRLSCALALAVIALAGAPALAQKPDERRWCEGEDGATPDQRISGCSAVIRGDARRARSWRRRSTIAALAYRLKGDLERAIQDYGQAIRVHAKFASAYNNRGVAYDKQGRVRPRHPGLRSGDQTQAVGGGPFQPRQRLSRRRTSTPPPSTTTTRRSGCKADFGRCLRQPLLGARRRRHPQAGARRLQRGAAADAGQCRHAGQPRLHLSEDDELRCRGLRLRRGAADRPASSPSHSTDAVWRGCGTMTPPAMPTSPRPRPFRLISPRSTRATACRTPSGNSKPSVVAPGMAAGRGDLSRVPATGGPNLRYKCPDV